jgi:penicillin-binding protein 1A
VAVTVGRSTTPPKLPSAHPLGPRLQLLRRVVVALAIAAAVGGVIGVGVASAIRVPNLEAYSGYTPRLITKLLDRNGDTFATYARERRYLIEEGKLPPLLQHAVLSAEDAQFFSHGGVDLLGIVRSGTLNLLRGRKAFGASTITMQLARQLMGRREKTWDRKITETFLAIELEKRLSKQQVLTMYCNLMYLSHGNYGMEAAARDYFGHGVDQLTLVEAATLAGILQRPSDFNPYRNPAAVTQRRNYVLRRMLEERYISRQDYQTATAQPLVLDPRHPTRELGPYFAEEVRQNLEQQFGTDRLYNEGLLAQTTLDATMQRDAEDAVREGLMKLDHRKGWRGAIAHGQSLQLGGDEVARLVGRNPDPESWVPGLVLRSSRTAAEVRTPDGEITVPAAGVAWTGRSSVSEVLRSGDIAWFRQDKAASPANAEPIWAVEQEPELEGAAVVLESATGAIRALVGGWDFSRSKYDRVTQAQRQVGSAFKPFVYGAAYENGFTPADTLFDAPTAFPGADGLASYAPRNYHRRYYGILTLRRALELSINVTAVKTLDLVGVDKVIDFARRCGLRSPLPPYPSLALGSADLTPIEMAAGYAAIANQGVWVRPYFIEQVRQNDGVVLSSHDVEASKATDPAVAYVLTHVMEGVVDRGTGAALADLPIAIAGKTGTTNDYTDAWFIGYTPRYTILAWVGYDQKKSIGRRMTGAEAALPIWRKIAEAGLLQGWLDKDDAFPVPAGVEMRNVDLDSGRLAIPGDPQVIQEAFLLGTAPAQSWDAHWSTVLSLPWTQQLAFYTPHPGERMTDDNAVALTEQLAQAEKEAGGE